MPYPEQKACFENICFKIYEELKIFVGNLGTTIGAKLCHARFRG